MVTIAMSKLTLSERIERIRQVTTQRYRRPMSYATFSVRSDGLASAPAWQSWHVDGILPRNYYITRKAEETLTLIERELGIED